MSWAEMPRSPGHAFYDKLQGADSVDHQARRHHVALQQTRKAERHDCPGQSGEEPRDKRLKV